MELEEQKQLLADSYESFLMSYAFGALDDMQNMIVRCHMELKREARTLVRSCEAVGGYFMEQDCEPVPMQDHALDSVMSRIEAQPKGTRIQTADNLKSMAGRKDWVPSSLGSIIQAPDSLKWKKVFSGISSYTLPIDHEVSRARLVKAEPSAKSPHHEHKGMEATLVLDGSFTDSTGEYRRGDLVIIDDPAIDHSPIASSETGCICMVVSTAPIRLKGWASMLNPFLRT